jgi:hypothetical protein
MNPNPKEPKNPLLSNPYKLPENRVTIVLGKRRYGKSTLCKRLLRETGGKRLVIDPHGEYDSYVDVGDIRDWVKDDLPPMKARFIPNEQTDMESIFGLIYSHGNVLLCIDEARMFQSLNYCPETLRYIAHFGRHRNIGLIVVARRPVEIHPDLYSQAERSYVFHVSDSRDLKTLRNYMTDTALAELPLLPVGTCISYDDSGVYVKGNSMQ